MSYNRIQSFDNFHALNEGKIPLYMPGDRIKASKSLRVVDVVRDFNKLLAQGQPFTVTVNTEGMKNVDHNKPEMDVIGVEGEGDKAIIVLKDSKGREQRILAGKILDVIIGDSVEHGIYLNVAYFIDGQRMKVVNFDGKDVDVYVHGAGERDIPLEGWKKMKKEEVD